MKILRRDPVKSTPPMSTRMLALTTCFGLALSGAFLSMPLAIPLAQADGAAVATYQPWTGTQQGKTTKAFLHDLKAKVAQAEKDDAASQDFIDDLNLLITNYEAAAIVSQAQPFFENFSDGDFTANPTWKVTTGVWRLDIKGKNIGLLSTVRQQSGLNTLLGGLLNAQGTQQQSNTQLAAIYTKAKLPAAFLASFKFTSVDRYGGLQMSLYQGGSAQNQYRLTYQPGNSQGLLLQRVSAGGLTDLGSYDGTINLEDGKSHELSFSRDPDGAMLVVMDGQTAITADDDSLGGNFDGILLTNVGGRYWVREVAVKRQN